MFTTILMVCCVVIGLVIALSALADTEMGKSLIKKVRPQPKLPPVQPLPEGPTPVIEDVEVPVRRPSTSKLANIVSEWESFVDTLIENDMDESAEAMKTLLNKVVSEYRNDLNEQGKEIEVATPQKKEASVDSIIAVPETAPSPKKGE